MPSGVIAGVTSIGDLHKSTHRTNAHRSALVLREVEPHGMAWHGMAHCEPKQRRRASAGTSHIATSRRTIKTSSRRPRHTARRMR